MNFAAFKFDIKNVHNRFMLLNSAQTLKRRGFYEYLVMILAAGQIDNFDVGVGVCVLNAGFEILWRHRSFCIYQKTPKKAKNQGF